MAQNVSSSSSSGGIGVLGLLGITFVILKLTGYIDWSWWWVTAPFWAGFAISGAIIILIVGVMFINDAFSAPRKRRQ